MADAPAVVFDTGVFVQAALRPRGPAARTVELVETGAIRLFISDYVLQEAEDVLRRRKVRAKNPHITDAGIEQLFARVRAVAMVIEPPSCGFNLERDPDDEPILDLVVAAGARYLVSRDNDVLDLATTSRADATDFRKRFPTVTILDPVDFLQEFSRMTAAQNGHE